jgi:hypothetical protein
MMSTYANLGAPWTSLMLFNNSGGRMRVVAPYHGIEMGVFPANELQSYIDAVWTFYASHTMPVRHSCGQDGGIVHSFTAQQSAGNLVFTENGIAKFQFPKPNTLTVYRNEIAPSPLPTDPLTLCLARGVALSSVAFVRTNLLVNTNLDACQLSHFMPTVRSSNMRNFSTSLASMAWLSFGYDDTCEQSSYITVQNPTAVSIEISGLLSEASRQHYPCTLQRVHGRFSQICGTGLADSLTILCVSSTWGRLRTRTHAAVLYSQAAWFSAASQSGCPAQSG